MTRAAPILEIRDLLKTFGAVVAAKDINIDISRGEIVGIIGANGAGHLARSVSPHHTNRPRAHRHNP